eukprot:6188921-Pleurochrysis_carterae.AAC.1
MASAGITPSKWPEPEQPCRMPVPSVESTDGLRARASAQLSSPRVAAAAASASAESQSVDIHSFASRIPFAPITMIEMPTAACKQLVSHISCDLTEHAVYGRESECWAQHTARVEVYMRQPTPGSQQQISAHI